MLGSETEFEGTDRFEVLSRLGAGGVGVVYEALDRETNQRVALKILRTKNAEMLLRFKEEFRGVQTVRHPNLVSLGELGETMGTWFFTMELVDGVNFIRWVREGLRGPGGELVGPVPYRDDRLRSALAQLAQALMALHRVQKVHRDIKPSNVLVTRSGRTVLLDFGFIADRVKSGHTTDGIVVGTADYMAPEQAAGRPVEAAADWYAVGVVLYRALTGRLPYSGSRMEVLLRKQQVPPVAPRQLIPDVPADLDQLCMSLLSIDLGTRATGEDILATVGNAAATQPSELVEPMDEHPFVGRQAELGQLHDAYVQARRGRSVTVYLTGESGVGKSALLHRFSSSVVQGDSRAFVLVGRCHERESVPYKGVDGVVDELSRALRNVPYDEAAAVLPLHIAALAQIFPVMRRVQAVAQTPPPMQDVQDPVEQRRRVFAAMRELFARIAERRPLVVIIEDLQWADADSLLLLKEVMQAPDEPSVLLVASTRTGQGAGARDALASVPRFLGADARADTRHLHVEGLPRSEARELAALLLRRTGGGASAGAEAIADEAAGHPLFIDELVQHASSGSAGEALPSLDNALWARICRLGERALRVLEMVCLAGGPLSQEAAAEAAELTFGEFSEQVAVLRNGKLIRTTGTARTDDIEPYHGRVRDAVLEHLSEPALEERHQRLALALEATSAADLQALAIHWRGAGDLQKSGAYAEEAAREAAEALAFERAARLYRDALEWRPVEGAFGRRLRRRLGDALANAGRGAEAAQAYLEAAEGSSAAAQLELTRLAADQLLRSGFIDEGLDALERVMAAAGIDGNTGGWRARLSSWVGKARLRSRGLRYRERDASQVSLEELTHIDIFWSASIGLASVDYIRGADYQTRHLLLALEAGEPYRICRALMTEVAYGTVGGEAGRKRTRRILELADEIADRIDNDHARGLVSLAAGIGGVLDGQWSRGLASCEAAELILRDYCTNVWWERTSGYVYSNWALVMLGRLADLAGRGLPRLREAEERGDLYATTNLRTGVANLAHLAANDPDLARAEALDAIRPWSRGGFTVQHAYDLLAQAHIDLYAGDAAAARQRIDAAWPALQSSRLLEVRLLHLVLLHLRGHAALAAAVAGDANAARDAARDVKALASAQAPWAEPLAALLAAGEAAVRGDENGAHRHLERAAEGFDAREMALFAAVARRRLGTLLGGETGAAMVREADRVLRGEWVKDPERFTALFAPGFDI